MGKPIGLLAASVFACVGLTGVAKAACTVVSNTVTCTGGQGASVAFATTGTASSSTVHAGTYPATLTVSGVPAGATVQSMSVRFNGLTALNTSSGCTSCGSARDVGIVLESPLSGASKRNLQVMSRIGAASGSSVSNLTILIQDGATSLPDTSTNWTTSGTFAPTNYDGTNEAGGNRDGEVSPDYTPTGPSTINLAQPTGTATMATAFSGATVNGTWNVYLADDAGFLFGLGANVSFTSFDLIITFSAATTPSTTTLTPSLASPFTSGANSSDVLTATVTSGATGTVTFKDGGTNLTCSGSNPATISGTTATCTTTFSTEGVHLLSAVYSGDGTFVSSTGSANVYAKNHATNVGTTYCNTGAIVSNGQSDGTYAATVPYPSVIFVGDGVNTDITNSVSTLSLQLKGLSSAAGVALRMLLVAPDGLHAFDFWDGPGSSVTSGNFTIQDGTTQLPSGAITAGTYSPTAINPPPSLFTPGPPAPAPQVPASYVYAAPAGTSTFGTAFNGAAAHGAWSLFLHDGNGPGVNASATGGWCLTITAATGHPTTTTLTSSANPSGVFGASTSFTATVSSSPTPNAGSVTFSENGAPLTGAPNGGVASVSNGVATIATTALPEGDHTITATYHDPANTFNDSLGTDTIRIDKATSTPTLNGSTWSYCNTGAIRIPLGTLGLNDIGPASPNPSNIMVTNLPGTVSSMSLALKGFHDNRPQNLETMLVGPNGASAPTAAQTFDFFSLGGGIVVFGPQDTTFSDSFTAAPLNSAPPASTGPASYGATSYTASPFFTLPGTIQHATTFGAFTFNTGTKTASSGGVYSNTVPDGVWSLYFDQNVHDTGSGVNGGWCLNFIENAVTGTGTTAHIGPAPNNHMKQGGTGSVTLSLHNNGDANANGPTGDPDGLHGLQVSGTLPSGLTFGTVPTGSPWSCTTPTSTTLSCKSSSAVAAGSDYPLLTLPVNVASNAPASVTVSGFTFSGAGMTTGTFSSDTITIDPPPSLSITKVHVGNFTQGSTAQWTITVANTALGSTDGSTITVTDSMPAGYTISSVVTGVEWGCTSTTQTSLLCTSTNVLAGGASLSAIAVHVNVPATSPVSVSNTAKVFGGGDPVHTGSGTAATSTDAVTVLQTPATVSLTAGNNQAVAVNTAFPTNLSATVLDAGSVVISGVTVTFTAPAAGASGTFAGGTNTKTAVTNASGVATATVYTSNTTAGGPYNISVTAGSITNNFSETNLAGPATQMTANAGTTPQSATISTAFTNPLAVTVKDAVNNPVSGVNVTFTAPGSGASGKFSNNTATITVATNAAGVASAPFTANATAGGPYTVTAAATGLTTVNFSLTNTTGAASSMTANAGTTPQSATVSTAFANALAVTVKDGGNNPVSGVNVTFTAPGSGASGIFSNSTATIVVATNASGVASAPFTANATAGGPYTVTAAATGLTTVNFSLTNTTGAASSMTANAGTTPQSATMSTAFANALAVTVKDAGNNPVSGVNVTFTAPGSGASGTFSNSTATITVATNASGVASAPFTANATAGGPYTVTAAASGLTTVSFSLTNTTGAASSMTANAGTTPQSATISTAFANALAVTVKDAGNSPVSGVNVTFTAPGSGASGRFSNNTATITVATNASGVASALFTANATAGGPYTVTAAATGLTTVNFSLTNTTGAASSMTANAGTTPQSATISTAFANALAVTVKDAGNSPVSGVNVTFTAPGSGASGIFSNSTATIVVATNASGVASAPFTANATAGGPYTVTAAATGLTTVNFSLTNSSPALQSIAVTPANPSVSKGLTQQFTATGTYADSSTQNLTSQVTWASATTSVATIASGGLATAVNSGTSTISATLSGVTGSTVMTVTAAVLQSIAVTPPNPSVAKGLTRQFTATGTYSDNSTQNLTSQVTWVSATTSTATITSGGLATAVNSGTSTISATLSGVTGSTVMTVTAATLQSIAVTPANPSVPKGLTQQFTATGTYSDNSTQNLTSTVTWASATTSTATITSGGLATAVNAGTSTISATLSGVTGSTVMTVTAAVLQSTAVTPANPSVLKGLTQQFTATGTFSDNSTQNLTSSVTWASATTSTATITSGGLATAVNIGTSNISATLGGVSGSTVLTVTGGSTPPAVVSFNVVFGSQSYNVSGSPRNRLPWQITGIQVVFSAPITTGDVNSLSGVTPTGFSGLGTNTLTWTINPISLGQFTATLAGSGLDALTDVNGGALGNGAGATQLLRVLYGDFNDDGVVNAADQTSVLVARSAPYSVFADINGNGVVDTLDVQLVRTQIGNTLP